MSPYMIDFELIDNKIVFTVYVRATYHEASKHKLHPDYCLSYTGNIDVNNALQAIEQLDNITEKIATKG